MAGDTVGIVDQALQVLRALADTPSPLGVRELGRKLHVNKSSVQRILTSLVKAGFAFVDPRTGRYSIAPGVLTLGWRFFAESEALKVSRDILARLRDESRETVALSTIVGVHRVTLLELESPEPLRFTIGVGRPLSLLTGATGRVLLAQLPQERARLLVEAQEPVEGGEGAITDRRRFLARLSVVRRAGYEFSRNEWSNGSAAVSVPVGIHQGMPFAISIYGPTVRLPVSRCKSLLPLLRQAAEECRAIGARWFTGEQATDTD